MGQFDGSERAEAQVAGKLYGELALEAQVLLAKFKGFAHLVPGFGARFLAEVVDPMVAEMRRAAGPGGEAARSAEAEVTAAADAAATVHPFEPRRAAPPAPPPSYAQVPTSEIQACIVQALEDSGDPMRIDDLQTILEDQRHAVTASNLSVILHRMVRNGLIHRPHRGVYAPMPSDKVRRMRGE